MVGVVARGQDSRTHKNSRDVTPKKHSSNQTWSQCPSVQRNANPNTFTIRCGHRLVRRQHIETHRHTCEDSVRERRAWSENYFDANLEHNSIFKIVKLLTHVDLRSFFFHPLHQHFQEMYQLYAAGYILMMHRTNCFVHQPISGTQSRCQGWAAH